MKTVVGMYESSGLSLNPAISEDEHFIVSRNFSDQMPRPSLLHLCQVQLPRLKDPF